MTGNTTSSNAADLLRFEWAVRALAQDADTQMTLYPHFTCVADELALDFDEHRRKLTGTDYTLSEEQAVVIEQLDNRIASISGPNNERFWTDGALKAAPEWNEIRLLARSVLREMGWPDAPPPANRALYIGPNA